MKGFKEFLLRGNIVDLAVAVVIGGAFGALVTALVKDLITPIIAAIVASIINTFFPDASHSIVKMSWQTIELALQFLG